MGTGHRDAAHLVPDVLRGRKSGHRARHFDVRAFDDGHELVGGAEDELRRDPDHGQSSAVGGCSGPGGRDASVST